MKNIKHLFLLALPLLIISCEPISSVAINGKKKLILKEDMGCNVKFIVDVYQFSTYQFFLLNRRSHIDLVNVKSFMNLLSEHNEDFNGFYPFYRDKDTISIDDRRYLFSGRLKDHIDRKKDIEFIIPPNEYVLCNGSPLFTDSLKAILKMGKIRVGPRMY